MAFQFPAPIFTGKVVLHFGVMPRGLFSVESLNFCFPPLATMIHLHFTNLFHLHYLDCPSSSPGRPGDQERWRLLFFHRSGNWGPKTGGNFSKITHPASYKGKNLHSGLLTHGGVFFPLYHVIEKNKFRGHLTGTPIIPLGAPGFKKKQVAVAPQWWEKQAKSWNLFYFNYFTWLLGFQSQLPRGATPVNERKEENEPVCYSWEWWRLEQTTVLVTNW